MRGKDDATNDERARYIRGFTGDVDGSRKRGMAKKATSQAGRSTVGLQTGRRGSKRENEIGEPRTLAIRNKPGRRQATKRLDKKEIPGPGGAVLCRGLCPTFRIGDEALSMSLTAGRTAVASTQRHGQAE